MSKFISLVSFVFSCQVAFAGQTAINDFKNVKPSLVPLAEATKAIADRYISEGKTSRYSMIGISEKGENIYSTVGFWFGYGDISGFKFTIGEMDDFYTFIVSVNFEVEGVDGSDPKKISKVKSAFSDSKLEFEQVPTKGGRPDFAARFWGKVPRKFSSDVLAQTINPRVDGFLKVYRSNNRQFRVLLEEGLDITNLRKIMDGTGINYTLDEDGDAKVVFSYGDVKRKQQVWIQSKLREVGSYKIRRVYSYAHAGKDIPDQAILTDALIMNHGLETSRWSMLPLPDQNLNALVLTALVPEDADSATITSIIKGISLRADNFEEKHFKEDVR